MAEEDDRLALQEAAEQGDAEAETAAAKAEIHELIKKFKNKVTWFNGKKYWFMEGIPYSDNPKRCVYLLGTLGGGQGKTEFSLWNVKFQEDGKIKLRPYEGADSEALEVQLLEDYLEHPLDDDFVFADA